MSFHGASLQVMDSDRLLTLKGRLLACDGVTAELLAAVATIPRLGSIPSSRLARLIDAAAWTDAALALVEYGLPGWQLRRLAYDEGEWHCALSRQRELPEWLDQAVETRHRDHDLAILQAVVEALRQEPPTGGGGVHHVPRVALRRDVLMCCDNFS